MMIDSHYTNEDDWDDENTNSVCVNTGNLFQLGYLRKESPCTLGT